jgi:hypothetical protein
MEDESIAIFDFQLPICEYAFQSAIGNGQLAMNH